MNGIDTLSMEKRDQILRGAASVFAADGYEGASMAVDTCAIASSTPFHLPLHEAQSSMTD